LKKALPTFFTGFVLFTICSISVSAQNVGVNNTNPQSTFDISGSFGNAITTVSSATTIDDTYGTILATPSSAFTITLPSVSTSRRRIYRIVYNGTSGGNTITIKGNASDNIIVGSTSANTITLSSGSVTLQSDGSNWYSLQNTVTSNAWLLTGNGGTSAGTNFIGTTDANDFVTKTDGSEHMRVTSAGDVVIGAGDASASATGGNLRAGNKTGSNATGPDLTIESGDGTGTGGSGNILFQTASPGSTGTTANTLSERMRVTPTGNLLVGETSPTFTNDLVEALANSTYPVGIRGIGISSLGFGIYAKNTNTNGTGLLCGGNGYTVIFLSSGCGGAFHGRQGGEVATADTFGTVCEGDFPYLPQTQFEFPSLPTGGAPLTAGGVFTGLHYGVVGVTDTSKNAIGSSFQTANSGVYGTFFTNTEGSWSFGVNGYGSSTKKKTGGVLGGDGSSDGALGYFTNAGTHYSVYGFGTAYQTGSNTGSPFHGGGNNEDVENNSSSDPLKVPNNQIGLGIYGGVMGGWVRGLEYGMNVKGKEYSLYVDGNAVTNQPIIQLIDNGTNKRTITYAVSSMTPDVYAHGMGQLVHGESDINFEDVFQGAVDPNKPVVVTITPMGDCEGVHMESVRSSGFHVKENKKGHSNVQFMWIAIGTRKDVSANQLAPDVVSKNYDSNMNGVMHNDTDPKGGNPIWWDGKQIRYDPIPDSYQKQMSTVKMTEPRSSKATIQKDTLGASTKPISSHPVIVKPLQHN
jgi:hypothetical protein